MDPVTPAPQEPPATPPQTSESATPPTFDEWYATQDETAKSIIESRFTVLENTVRATRDERDGLSKQIKALAKQQTEGSEAKKQLEEMSATLEKTEKRAAFLEDAMKPEIQCRNPRAAWLLAEAEGLFSKNGSPDWEAIKREAPELFGLPVAKANAGEGTQNPPSPHRDMNAFIRQAAGRK